MRIWGVTLAAATLACALPASAAPLTAQQQHDIDASVGEWLAKAGAPSVSIAVASGGEVVYAKAYGKARLAPDKAATPTTRYAIDSISKEFTASAMLRLQEEGKLSLDDRVAKYFPELASADQVTIRQILSHTAGYRDYWPQDYVTVEMGKPTTVLAVLDEWAKKPLDFAPGTDWQYSNTGFVIAGAIVEKVSGQPLVEFLRANLFAPLKMQDVTDADQRALGPADAGAYTRAGNGPVRPAPKEGAGWLFAAGELAMAPRELAKWDISLMARALLTPASYDALYTPIKLTTGLDSRYSLGLGVREDHGRLVISHGGGGSGFLSANVMFPKDKIAIVAFTNNDWADPGAVAQRVAFAVLPPTAAEARARAVFDGFRAGAVDRGQFTDNGNAYLTAAVLADQKAGLAAFGPARLFELQGESTRGGLRTRNWKITTAKGSLSVVERGYPDGKLEQFMVSKAD
ncbi:serine hydrolase domain-containing protein [Phenylobacterium sp.]|uniref:serine hydrolase domain-containing protein n=1 Tax=Phenylobacterium sp. TaxID=1871053 RepID=UPI002BA81D55|nr:serine hydrolase domain-containing protein [Phenylobacterium sp.]HLZ75046.1 serine hydrolase domain-containing protein [Phenylobacterium sp.]